MQVTNQPVLNIRCQFLPHFLEAMVIVVCQKRHIGCHRPNCIHPM